jgi:hypothetical protein
MLLFDKEEEENPSVGLEEFQRNKKTFLSDKKIFCWVSAMSTTASALECR